MTSSAEMRSAEMNAMNSSSCVNHMGSMRDTRKNTTRGEYSERQKYNSECWQACTQISERKCPYGHHAALPSKPRKHSMRQIKVRNGVATVHVGV